MSPHKSDHYSCASSLNVQDDLNGDNFACPRSPLPVAKPVKVALLRQVWDLGTGAIATLLYWFASSNEPVIREKRDRSGQLFWEVCDPKTGYRARFVSQDEVLQWLEERWHCPHASDPGTQGWLEDRRFPWY